MKIYSGILASWNFYYSKSTLDPENPLAILTRNILTELNNVFRSFKITYGINSQNEDKGSYTFERDDGILTSQQVYNIITNNTIYNNLLNEIVHIRIFGQTLLRYERNQEIYSEFIGQQNRGPFGDDDPLDGIIWISMYDDKSYNRVILTVNTGTDIWVINDPKSIEIDQIKSENSKTLHKILSTMEKLNNVIDKDFNSEKYRFEMVNDFPFLISK